MPCGSLMRCAGYGTRQTFQPIAARARPHRAGSGTGRQGPRSVAPRSINRSATSRRAPRRHGRPSRVEDTIGRCRRLDRLEPTRRSDATIGKLPGMAVGAVARLGRVSGPGSGNDSTHRERSPLKELRAWRKRLGKLERAGQLGAADAEARRMAARRPRSPYVHLTVGEFHLGRGQMEAAVSAFRTAWRVRKRGRWKVARRLARGMTGAGRTRRRSSSWGRSRSDGPGPPLRRAGIPLRAPRARRRSRRGAYGGASEESALRARLDQLDRPPGKPRPSRGSRRHAPPARRASARRSPADIVEAIAAEAGESSRCVVNLGCGDGKTKRALLRAPYKRGYGGLAVDAVEHPRLRRNLPQPEVRKVVGTELTPANVVDLLEREGCPCEPILLKIDIDSFDGPLLEAALAGFEPDVIHIEVNPDFPPPLKFAVQYDPRYSPSGRAGFFGCSVAYVTSIARPPATSSCEIDFSHPTRGQDADAREEAVSPPLRARGSGSRGRTRAVPGAAVRWLARTRRNRSRHRGVADEPDFQALLSKAWDACVAASVHRSGSVLPSSSACRSHFTGSSPASVSSRTRSSTPTEGRRAYPGTHGLDTTSAGVDAVAAPRQIVRMRTVCAGRPPPAPPAASASDLEWVDAWLEARSR